MTENLPDTNVGNIEYIRKQDAVDAICCNITITGRQNAEIVASTIGKFADRIKAIQPVDVAPAVHGHWIPYRCDMYECSVCQHIHTSFDNEECDANFCPNCGAKMDGEEDNV